MNLEESDLFKEQLEKDTSRKKAIIIALAVCALLVIVMIALISYISYRDRHTYKIFVNKQSLKSKKVNYMTVKASDIEDELIAEYGWDEEDLPEYESDPIYIDVKALAESIGYKHSVGGYKKSYEDTSSATFNSGYEIASFSAGSEYYQKYLNPDALKDKEGFAGIKEVVFSNNPATYEENYKFSSPPLIINDVMYVALEDIPKMFNLVVDWRDEYWKYITTLDNVVKSTKLPAGYTILSGYYENLRAMVDGYVVVSSGEAKDKATTYGVYKKSDYTEPFITVQYSNVLYQQNVQQFYLTDSEGKVGLAVDNGDTQARVLVSPGDYTNISLIDDKLNLYLVEKDEEYGVIQKADEMLTIVNPEFDEIGFDYTQDFSNSDLGTSNIWCEKLIPVKKNNKVGLYKIGNPRNGSLQALAPIFEGFGYISIDEQSSGNEENLLVVPPETGVYGIVISRNGAYGLYDINAEKVVLQCVYDKFYSVTENGIKTYYCEYGGNTYELSEYFSNVDGNGLSIKDVDKNGKYIGNKQGYVDDEDNDTFDVEKFNEGLVKYEGEQSGSSVKVLLNNLAKNAEDNAKDINLIPSIEFYRSEEESEMIEASKDDTNNQQSYITDIESVEAEITKQMKFDVEFEYNENNIVTNVVIKRSIEKSTTELEAQEQEPEEE